jgi:hypothetical protein
LLKVDRDWDLAALLIWRPKVDPMPICTTAPQPGDPLTIAGYGQGDYRAVTGKCTQYLAPSVKHPYEIVELSAAARKGDSGGPIMNERSELVGVLFGADRATTSGSYCGRVRWFLTSVWPELDDTSSNTRTSVPLVGFPAEPNPSIDQPMEPKLIPIPAPTTSADPGTSAGSSFDSSLDSPADLAPSVPYTPLPLASTSSNSDLNWNRLVGSTRLDQAKSILAAIGILALWSHLSRWLGN